VSLWMPTAINPGNNRCNKTDSSVEEIQVHNAACPPHIGNSPAYTWFGNHWRPPPGVPLYSADDMRRIFTQGNVLWIGDSTARQDYVTLYNILTANTPKNIPVIDLEEGINVNKRGKTTEPCQRHKKMDLLLCRTLDGSKDTFYYDYTERICWNDVVHYVTANQEHLLRIYSTIIFSVGIWDVLRIDHCGNKNAIYVWDVLDTIHQNLTFSNENSNLRILWKVHTGAGNENITQMERSADIQRLTREWFIAHPPEDKMRMVDLAKEMEGRTYGPSRIEGDISPHLGPIARTLFLQMAAHVLELSQECFENSEHEYRDEWFAR
jgi:hypothetical protein